MTLEMHDTVRDAVLRRLDLLDDAADAGDPRTLLPLARSEINRLAAGWRLLLQLHRCDEEGRCQECSEDRHGRRAVRWPCQIWQTAHEQLIGEGVPHGKRTGPLRNPLSRLARNRHRV